MEPTDANTQSPSDAEDSECPPLPAEVAIAVAAVVTSGDDGGVHPAEPSSNTSSDTRNVAPPSQEEVFDPTDIIRGQVDTPARECVGVNSLSPRLTGSDQTTNLPTNPMTNNEPIMKASTEAITPPDDPINSAVFIPNTLTENDPESASAERDVPMSLPKNAGPVTQSTTKALWAQLFGSRYEEANEATQVSINLRGNITRSATTTTTANGRASLRTKLDLGRQLDAQIQSARQRRRFSTHTNERTPNSTCKTPTITSSQHQMLGRQQTRGEIIESVLPLESAGLSCTSVRVCSEKALARMCGTLRGLHAVAQQEPRPSKDDKELGVFVMRWELDLLLEHLLHTSSEKLPDVALNAPTNAPTQLLFHNPEYALPLATQLQVSWFLPFQQYPRLRSLVAQISRRHLNEQQVAELHLMLHRQLIRLPHASSFQKLILRILSHANEPPLDTGSILRALFITGPNATSVHATITIAELMRLPPVDLVERLSLTSIVSLQRLVMFRFLVKAIGTELAQLGPSTGSHPWIPKPLNPRRQVSTSKKLATTVDHDPHTTRKTKRRAKSTRQAKIRTRSKAERGANHEDADNNQEHSDSEPTSSRTMIEERRAHILDDANQQGDQQEPDDFEFSRHELASVLDWMRETMPWAIDGRRVTAEKTVFIAAQAFLQSLELVTRQNTVPGEDVVIKLRELIRSITEILHNEESSSSPPPWSAPLNEEATPPPHYPPSPSPSPSEQEQPPASGPNVQKPDSIKKATLFPPPYAEPVASYWTFQPELPSSPDKTQASIPRSTSKDKLRQPGVGHYDITKGDHITFQRRPNCTFATSDLAPPTSSIASIHRPKSPYSPKWRRKSTSSPARGLSSPFSGSATNRQGDRTPGMTHRSMDDTDSSNMAEADDGMDLEPPQYSDANVQETKETKDKDDPVLTHQLREVERRQQSLVVSELMQDLLLQRPPSPRRQPRGSGFVARIRQSPRESAFTGRNTDRKTSAVSSPVKREVTRHHTTRPTAATGDPSIPPPSWSKATNGAKNESIPHNEHHEWAERVRSFYRAKLELSGSS